MVVEVIAGDVSLYDKSNQAQVAGLLKCNFYMDE